MSKFLLTLTTIALMLSITACNEESDKAEKVSLEIPVNGSVSKTFHFEDNEPILNHNGCIVSSLSQQEDGTHFYTARNYYGNGITAYGLVYAKSMSTQPYPLVNGEISLFAGGVTLRKINTDKYVSIDADYYGVGLSLYDENLTEIDATTCSFCQGSQSFNLDPGTYYLKVTNGSCKTDGRNVYISISE